jgi:hypothetical protein
MIRPFNSKLPNYTVDLYKVENNTACMFIGVQRSLTNVVFGLANNYVKCELCVEKLSVKEHY